METNGEIISVVTQMMNDFSIRDVEAPDAIVVTPQSTSPYSVADADDQTVFQCTPAKSSSSSHISHIETPSQSAILDTAVFSTPINQQNICCTDATCSVCLSPLLCRAALVETRCKHVFHEKCLLEAKGRKAECPNCRASLTPLQPALPSTEDGFPPVTFDFSMGQRNAIISRSAAVREAVRLGTVRREHERQRALAEALENNKENL